MASNLQALDRLKSQLLTSGIQEKNQPLFQVINQLIDFVRQGFNETQEDIASGTGSPGPPGPVGPPGVSSSVFFYRVDTTNTAPNDPGAGKYKYNTVDQHLATNLYFDWLTEDDFDAHILFQLMAPADKILIQDKDLANNYQIFELTGPAIVHPDWFEIPVNFISSSGAGVFTNNQHVAVLIKSESSVASVGPPAMWVGNEVDEDESDPVPVFTPSPIITELSRFDSSGYLVRTPTGKIIGGNVIEGETGGISVADPSGIGGASIVSLNINGLVVVPAVDPMDDYLVIYDGSAFNNKKLRIDTLISLVPISGNVIGPAFATDSALAVFDGATGKLLKNSTVLYDGTSLNIRGSHAGISFFDTSSAVDTRFSKWQTVGGTLGLFMMDDAQTTIQSTPIQFFRNGDVTVGGNLNVNGTGGNVALKNVVNQFTMNQRISNAGGDYPRLTFTDLTRPINEKVWQIIINSSLFRIWALNDAESSIIVDVSIDRSSQLTGALLDAGAINRGTIADARLSSNVALKNIDNFFSATQSITGNIVAQHANITGNIDNPTLVIWGSDNPTNPGRPWMRSNVGAANPYLVINSASVLYFNVDTAASIYLGGPLIATSLSASGVLTSGTFTPSSYLHINMTSVTVYTAQYMRVGNTVTVSGKVDINPAAAGGAWFDVSIPISSNLSASGNQAAGTFAAIDCYGHIFGDNSAGWMRVQFVANGPGNRAAFYTYTYLIV